MKEIKLDEKTLNGLRSFIKTAYVSIGHLEGVKNTGCKVNDVDFTIDTIKQFIKVIELLIDEENIYEISDGKKLNKEDISKLKKFF